MTIHVTKLTTKAQTTVPRAVRDALGVRPGDSVLYRVEDGRVVMEKAPADAAVWAAARAAWGPSWDVFAEDWLSPEDCAAYDDL